MSERSELLDLIIEAQHNPGLVHRAMIDQVERTYNGELELIDPMNPFIFLLEASSVVGAAGMRQAETLTRRQYPSAALTMEELYLHMSDYDYIGRFAAPASTTMLVLLGKEEVMYKAVATGSGNVRKLTIPRHTRFTVADTMFTLQYPIDIRVMGHGGIQVVYDNDKLSPLQSLESNKVTWSVQNYNATHSEYLMLEIPVLQVRLESYTASLNATTAFKKSYRFTDQFYYCRAFLADSSGNWVEVKTTHSEQVFDPLTPTVLLKVIDDVLEVSVPQVYFTTGIMTTELRMDLYTTKGPLEMNLGNYVANQFVARWLDLDNDDGGKYVAPLSTMTTISVMSDAMVTGGTTGLSFEEQRLRTMGNATGTNDVPITDAQLTSRLEDLGYSAVLKIDNITRRIFLATRALPVPTDGVLSSGAGATMATLMASFEDLIALETTSDNGNRITLTPETLYLNRNGVLEIVADDRRKDIASLDLEDLAALVTDEEYLYSPLHYVLDINDNTFKIRPYYIGAPDILSKHFIEDNDTTGLGVNSATHEIAKTSTGWKLTVLLDSTESFKLVNDANVYVQLSFRPSDEQDEAFINGTLIGKHPDTGERIYEFDILCNWDIDRDHQLYLTNFTLYDPADRTLPTGLTTDFNLTYGVANYTMEGMQESILDTLVGKHLLPEQFVAIYREKLSIKLADNLEGLWARARSVIGTQSYVTYEKDIPNTYPANVYRRDETGGAVFTVVDGKPVFELLHAKGEVVVDQNGEIDYLHRKGDLVLDENGDPVVDDPRAMVRQMSLFVIDGAYYYATTALDTSYRTSVPTSLVTWLTKDLIPLSKKLLEQTEVFLHPKSTIGSINVIVEEGKTTQISAAQSLQVVYYVTRAVYTDTDLRKAITTSTISVISSIFKKAVVTRDDIQSQLKTSMGTDIVACKVNGLGGSDDYTAISIVDDSARLCIGKKLAAMANGTLAVQDAIDVDFRLHRDV